MPNDTTAAVELSDRERHAIVGALKMLGAQAWDEKLHGQPLTGEDVAGLFEIATDSYRFDMLRPDEIEALCVRIAACE